jgi:cyanophycinase
VGGPGSRTGPRGRLDPERNARREPGLRALFVVLVGLAFLTSACATASSTVQEASFVPDGIRLVGPPNGALVLAGGGTLSPDIWERFVELAGGPDARIVVIPTAGTLDQFPDDWSGLYELRRAGARNLKVLHTRDRTEADSHEFVRPLREATGVWFPGGRQWRLVDAYLDTRVHRELFDLLDRGGVVGGTSAGASIQASFLVRGDPETNQILMSPDYEEGFGLLPGTAVDQHLHQRERENDLWEVLERHPDLLGIGLDEGTAMVIRGNRAEVIGSSMALIYTSVDPTRRPRPLRAGELFDLGLGIPIPVVVEEDRDGAGPSP